VSLLAPAALTPLAAYAADLAGVAFTPLPMAALAAMAFLFCGALLFRRAKPDGVGLMLGAAAGALLLAWLLWLSAPSLLPLGTGPDLTHHLMLVRHIETHWRLVHDPALEQSLGEMAHYTPGSHILVALAGAWSGTDGLRAMHGVQAWTVALKAVFLVAVCLRLLPPRAPRLLAALGPVLLLESPRYFLGGFTEFGFLAQVVAELPAVAMWWALVAWADSRADLALGVFGAAGAAAFLAWPVYVGPPALAAGVLIASRGRRPFARRVRDLAVAFAPLALVAAAFAIGRLGWLRLAGTGGLAPWPSIAAYGRPLVVLSAAGLLVAAARSGDARPSASRWQSSSRPRLSAWWRGGPGRRSPTWPSRWAICCCGRWRPARSRRRARPGPGWTEPSACPAPGATPRRSSSRHRRWPWQPGLCLRGLGSSIRARLPCPCRSMRPAGGPAPDCRRPASSIWSATMKPPTGCTWPCWGIPARRRDPPTIPPTNRPTRSCAG